MAQLIRWISRNSITRTAGNFDISYPVVQAPSPERIYEYVPGSNLIGIDPVSRPLTDNGGPALTRAPRKGSPVIDDGNPDQRLDP